VAQQKWYLDQSPDDDYSTHDKSNRDDHNRDAAPGVTRLLPMGRKSFESNEVRAAEHDGCNQRAGGESFKPQLWPQMKSALDH
jgi:hypothetical protein